MTRLDYWSEVRAEKALVLRRFSLAAARQMCGGGADMRAADMCPSCRGPDVIYMTPGFGLTGAKVAANIETAERVMCRGCGFRGDAVQYVMARFNISSTEFAIARIEDFLRLEAS